nr:hypothetical protein [Deinococcus geothermalis]
MGRCVPARLSYTAPVFLVSWTRRVRLLAALLALIAGLVYPVRNLPDVWLLGGPPHSADHCGGPPEHGSFPSAAHDTHCLFCLTGAFADGPPAPLRVAPGADPRAVIRPAAPQVPHPPVAHADARAPPHTAA